MAMSKKEAKASQNSIFMPTKLQENSLKKLAFLLQVKLAALARSRTLKKKVVCPPPAGSAWQKMETCKVFDEVHRHRCFPTLQDALAILEHKSKKAQ